MLDDAFQIGTDTALQDMMSRPLPPPKPKPPSMWRQAAEILKSPFKGAGQGVMQSTRAANTVVPISAGNPLAMSAAEQEEMLTSSGITREALDQSLRAGIDKLQPDPITSTFASQFVQSGARLLTKVAGYGMLAGPVGAVVGTGVDEGITGAQEMRDQGVDAGTAAKVGLIRGAAVSASVALPVVGKTVAGTVGLVATGGPAMFVGEQALTREVLNRANYGGVAKGYDPFDPMGLALSAFVPGAVGLAVHRARVRKAKAPIVEASPTLAEEVPHVAEIDPDLVDAALVAHRSDLVRNAMLGDLADLKVGESHYKALDEGIRALEDGAPLRAPDVQLDPLRAAQAAEFMHTRMSASLEEFRAELRTVDEVLPIDAAPVVERVAARSNRLMPSVGGYNLDNLLAQADAALGPGRAIRDAIGEPGVTQELHNAMVGVSEFRDRLPELEEQFRAIEWNRNGKATVTDMLADAVGRMREGQPPEPVERSLGRAAQIAREYPDLPVRMDEAGDARPAAQMVSEARMQARRDKADGKAFSAAIECMLRFGA